jgi:hypothetical protein
MSLTIKNSIRSIKRSRETQKNAQPFLRKRSMSYLCIFVIISQKKIVLGKGLKIVRYKSFIRKHNQALNQFLKRKEQKCKAIKKKEEDVEDEFANQFNDTMNISTKRRRVEDVE